MSIPRYKPNPLWIGMPIVDDKEGKLCEYRDYVKLEAENARLKAEVERLTKAGTYLCSTMEVNGIHDNGDIEMHERAIALWRAAKEGKQSV